MKEFKDNLNKIATIAQVEKKTSKNELFHILANMINDGSCTLPESEQAKIYAHFLPTKPSNTKKDLTWIYRASGTSDFRDYLNTAWVAKNGDLVASDGYRMHIVKGHSQNIEDNTPICKKGDMGNKSDYSRNFVDYQRVSNIRSHRDSKPLSDLDLSYTAQFSNSRFIHLITIDGTHNINLVYWQEALSGMYNDRVMITLVGDRVHIECGSKQATIMCVRV